MNVIDALQGCKMLQPSTPITVQFEDGEYHVYVEGQWHSRHADLASVNLQVEELIETHGDDWLHVCTRINPDWEGWKEISFFDLLALVCGEE